VVKRAAASGDGSACNCRRNDVQIFLPARLMSEVAENVGCPMPKTAHFGKVKKRAGKLGDAKARFTRW
jgi:hypothetical protein